jgi:crossover junction endodeoxyribonuclease RusA
MSGAPAVLAYLAEVTIAGPALSAQTRNRQRLEQWRHSVAAAARSQNPATAPAGDDVEVWISEFSEYPTRDRDNLAKPILDALQGVLYLNDRQVKRLSVEWCDLNGSYIVRYMSPVVAAALSTGAEFLWVRILAFEPRRGLTR